ncbi:MAG: hypothetical protein M3Y48_19655 [Actinomycetota bacterium]|nr:hypothetical protein [Actinomycetota bacterium]
MEAWIGVIGAVVGAVIALLGQYISNRSERRARDAALLLDQCAHLIALSEDYRNRVWEERNLVANGVVAEWNIGEFRLAEARLKILCKDKASVAAIGRLQSTGQELGKAWRLERSESEALDAAWRNHREALNNFSQISGDLVRRRISRV